MNPIQVLAGVAMVFLLPGLTLVYLLFPRRSELDPELDIVYRLALGMGLSVVIAIFVGFILDSMSNSENQYVRPGPLWIALGSLTAVFLVAGWYRGAYPVAGLIHPSLYRPTSDKKHALKGRDEFARKRTTERLLLEREQLLTDLQKFSERSALSNPQRKLYYQRRIENSRERVSAINKEIEKLGKR